MVESGIDFIFDVAKKVAATQLCETPFCQVRHDVSAFECFSRVLQCGRDGRSDVVAMATFQCNFSMSWANRNSDLLLWSKSGYMRRTGKNPQYLCFPSDLWF